MTWQVKAGLAAVLLLVVIKFVLVPLSKWQDETIQKIQVLQTAVAKKEALIGNEKEIDKLLKKAESSHTETAKHYKTDFSDSKSLQFKLQAQMEKLAKKSGIEITNTKWLFPSEGEIIQAPIRISCEGNPKKIIHFLSLIENGRHFTSVDILRIRSRDNSPIIRAEIHVSTYGLKKKS
jgi:hypothetical protein